VTACGLGRLTASVCGCEWCVIVLRVCLSSPRPVTETKWRLVAWPVHTINSTGLGLACTEYPPMLCFCMTQEAFLHYLLLNKFYPLLKYQEDGKQIYSVLTVPALPGFPVLRSPRFVADACWGMHIHKLLTSHVTNTTCKLPKLSIPHRHAADSTWWPRFGNWSPWFRHLLEHRRRNVRETLQHIAL